MLEWAHPQRRTPTFRENNIVKLSFSRRKFLHTSMTAAATLAAAGLATERHLFASMPTVAASPAKPAFPVADYHVHLSPTLTIEQAVALGKERGVQIGIVEHPGPNEKIKSDADLKQYIEGLRTY